MDRRTEFYYAELEKYKGSLSNKSIEEVKYHLGRAHILSQDNALRHVYVHWLMFKFSLKNFMLAESFGQLVRIVVTLPGHLIKKVPAGNIGWSSVGLTEKMPIPDDLKEVIK